MIYLKILLVNTPIWKDNGFRSAYNPGMGLLYIGAVLREKGHHVRIVDAEALGWWTEEIVRECKTGGYSHVGISSLSNGLHNATRICEAIKKEDANIWVALGGVGPSAEVERAKNSMADSICVGEGESVAEKVFLERGVHYGEPVQDLDSLPMPAYDLLEPRIGSEYWSGNLPRPPVENIRETVVMWSRGCPHACIFCSKATMKRGKPRLRSPDNIVKELKMLRDDFGINSIFVYDDELIGMGLEHNEWVNDIMVSIMAEDVDDLRFKAQGRCSEKFITKELTETMVFAGFFAMMMGCESGSENVKRRIKKGTTNDDIRHTLKTLSDGGIDVYGFWMVGMPEETEDDVRETEKLILETAKYMSWLQVTVFSPLPGSEFWKEATDNEWISADFDYSKNFQVAGVLKMPWMTPDLIMKWQKRLNSAYEWVITSGN